MDYINNQPLTLKNSQEVAPELLLNAIDERIVKIRPMATPIDQLSRCAGARPCNAMNVEYYSVDVKPTSAQITSATAGTDGEITVQTTNNRLFVPTETVLAVGSDNNPASLYIVSAEAEGLTVLPASESVTAETLKSGMTLVRMGRAATELDVQTPQFESLPRKSSNYCQIFKMQIEESTLHKLANKEVGWTFSDQEEVAVIDMRQGMEKNFLFGQKAVIEDPGKRESVYLTGGIWQQTTKEFKYTATRFTSGTLIELCRQAFTGCGGASRKILVAGSGLVELLSKLAADKVIGAAQTMVKWGIEFREIRTNFGTLYVVHSEIFDQCGHADDGFILDPEYLTKYVHIPFNATMLNLRNSGQRNTDAVVITEASCLVLRHPGAHMRVVKG